MFDNDIWETRQLFWKHDLRKYPVFGYLKQTGKNPVKTYLPKYPITGYSPDGTSLIARL